MKSPFDLGKMDLNKAVSVCLFSTILPFLSANAGSTTSPAEQASQLADIYDQGFNHSEIALLASHLTDDIGQRLTNSPAERLAQHWAEEKFRGWGLQNVHSEGLTFGRGWVMRSVSVRMVEPRVQQLYGMTIAWTPSTPGPVTAPIIVAPIHREEDLDPWRGKLKGAFVLVDDIGAGSEPTEPEFHRFTDAELQKLDGFQVPNHEAENLPDWMRGIALQAKIDAFLASEGAFGRIRGSRTDAGLLHGEGYQFVSGAAVPGVELSAEDYRRLARLAIRHQVKLEIDSETQFDDTDRETYNVIADISGTDPAAGYLLIGAHLDSWTAGDGAADDGAGVAIVMEAARILAARHIHPRRTIRFALWSGEEQGMLGSKAYVTQHVATRPAAPVGTTGPDDVYYWPRRYPITARSDYNKIWAYFNIDEGSGRIRGLYCQGDLVAIPALKELFEPFAVFGATEVSGENMEGGDHVTFAGVGIPAFEMIQDPLDYDVRVHHTNLDTYDHLKIPDLQQAAVVMAGLVLRAADSISPLPRVAPPTSPSLTDPLMQTVQ